MSANTRLSDILQGKLDSLSAAWDTTEAAEEFTPLPAGTYDGRIIDGELFQSRNGTAGYKITFEIVNGDSPAAECDYAGRRLWMDLWLTKAALPMSKRDLGKLALTDLEQLEKPLPHMWRVKLRIVMRQGEDGQVYNRVKDFEVVGVDEPEKDAFDIEAPGDSAADLTPGGEI